MRKLLVVVDMQNDFVDGALGTAEAVAIVPNVVEKMKQYAPEDIFVTYDTHTENYMETLEGKYLPVPHCIKGTSGFELNPQIDKAAEGATRVEKPTFGSENLANIIYEISKTEQVEIELVGLCTDICVVSNALLLKAKMPETDIYVDPSCCAGVTPATHEAALATMKMCQIQMR